ncbi:hypothetical protein GCM10023083_80610 [Streptomyces phyllanthi]
MARTAAERRLYQSVARAAHRVDPQPAPALKTLLVVPEDRRVPELERLRTPPVRARSQPECPVTPNLERVPSKTERRGSRSAGWQAR